MRLIDADAAIEAIAHCSIYGVDEIKTQCEQIIYEENGWLGGLKDAIEAVEDMPTIEQPQTGKWIPVEDSDCWRGYVCDKCGKAVNQRENFCPNCGSRMEKK